RQSDAELGRVAFAQHAQRLRVNIADGRGSHGLFVTADKRGAVDQGLAGRRQQAVHAEVIAGLPGAIEGARVAGGVLGDGRGRGGGRRFGRRGRVHAGIAQSRRCATGGRGGDQEKEQQNTELWFHGAYKSPVDASSIANSVGRGWQYYV